MQHFVTQMALKLEIFEFYLDLVREIQLNICPFLNLLIESKAKVLF